MSLQANSINYGIPTSSLSLPALKYLSGNRTWYAITIPYKTLGKFVQTSAVKKKNMEIIKKDIKNRFLDPKHKNDIKKYIEDEPEFTLPPITLVSYEELIFKMITFPGAELNEDDLLKANGSVMGIIYLPLDYEFECLDGNHRTAAIRDLCAEYPELITGSNMLLNIVYESRAKKIRQDFVDVNKNAKSTSSSINTYFNTRDLLAGLVADTIEENNYLNETTEFLSSSVSKNSKDIYTINNIKNAIIELSGYNSQSSTESRVSEQLKDDEYKKNLKKGVEFFFNALENNRDIQNCLIYREKTPNIRNSSVITSGTGLIVAARLANSIFKNLSEDVWEENINLIMDYDWSRNNQVFKNKILIDQKILSSREAVSVTVDAIKKELELE